MDPSLQASHGASKSCWVVRMHLIFLRRLSGDERR